MAARRQEGAISPSPPAPSDRWEAIHRLAAEHPARRVTGPPARPVQAVGAEHHPLRWSFVCGGADAVAPLVAPLVALLVAPLVALLVAPLVAPGPTSEGDKRPGQTLFSKDRGTPTTSLQG